MGTTGIKGPRARARCCTPDLNSLGVNAGAGPNKQPACVGIDEAQHIHQGLAQLRSQRLPC